VDEISMCDVPRPPTLFAAGRTAKGGGAARSARRRAGLPRNRRPVACTTAWPLAERRDLRKKPGPLGRRPFVREDWKSIAHPCHGRVARGGGRVFCLLVGGDRLGRQEQSRGIDGSVFSCSAEGVTLERVGAPAFSPDPDSGGWRVQADAGLEFADLLGDNAQDSSRRLRRFCFNGARGHAGDWFEPVALVKTVASGRPRPRGMQKATPPTGDDWPSSNRGHWALRNRVPRCGACAP